MEESETFKVKCCSCGTPIGQSGSHINIVCLNKRAEWDYPKAGNVLTGESGRAVAIVCDRCISLNKPSKYAVKFNGPLAKDVEYIPVENLMDFGGGKLHGALHKARV